MKTVLIIFLIVLVAGLGYGAYSLQKELINTKKDVEFYKERNNKLQSRLIQLERAYRTKENRLEEIRNNLSQLESKVDLDTLEKYVPDKTWKEINPIIERLRGLKRNDSY